jgi:hypothetical protein
MRRKVKDPVQRFGGKPIPGIVLLILIPLVLVAGAGSWYVSSEGGGFNEVEKLARVKCLGCLGLDPVVPDFSEYWIEYPDDHVKKGEDVPHPDQVHSILDDDDVDLFILFFWTQGCVPCAEQWDEMVEADIASGPEDGGIEGDRYETLRMISNDAAEETDLYHTYTPKGTETGVPMTTFLFKDREETILWWSHYGKMDLGDVEERIEEIFSFIEKDRLKGDYDDISSAE